MTTTNYSEQVHSAVSIAVGILTSPTPNIVLPVDTATISPPTSGAPVPSEISVPPTSSDSFQSPDVLVVTTSTTTTISFVDPVTQVATTDPVTPSSTLDVAPSSIPTTDSLLPTSAISTTDSTLTPSFIVPTTLTTLSSSSSPAQSTDPASDTSSTSPPTTSDQSSSNHLGAYIGAAVGGVAVILIFILALLCISRRRKHKQPKHHPDRPAFIGGYELKLDKAGDLQRVVHEKRVRRSTFEAWKRGVVPAIDPDDVAGKSEFNITGESQETGNSSSLAEVAEEVPNPNEEVPVGGLNGDDHDEYVVSPLEEEHGGWRSVEEEAEQEGGPGEKKSRRPISGITPLICEWERRADERGGSTTSSMIGVAL
ncbi:hypothetical protein NHQ30_004142 [Ciborinia camelliae]|nr:hypothetical protein NHQ30_004142 [Ciborinia camelliae]